MPRFKSRSLVLALIVSFACLFPANEGAGQPAPAPSAIFSNVPSEIAVQGLLPSGESPPPCSFFNIRLLGTQAPVLLTTSGLGDARLAPAASGDCPGDADRRWAREVRLAQTLARQRVAIRLTAEPRGSAERHGRLLAFSSDGPLGSADIIVRRAPPVPLWTELKWFVGFILPALAAYFATRVAVARAERRQQHNDLVVFRTVDKNKVDAVVADVKTVLAGPGKYKHPGWQILQSLRDQDIIAKLPNRDKEALVLLCENDDWKGAAALMARLFPLHADDLAQARRPPRKKAGTP